MNIRYEYPPNIEKIRAAFTLHKGIVFTYGDTIYNPDGGDINEPLMRHEELHTKQQGDDPEAWWDRYLIDAQWRATQELAAYRVQYKAVRKLYLDRNYRHKYLTKLASDLSGAMYGNCMSFSAAMKAIKHEKLF